MCGCVWGLCAGFHLPGCRERKTERITGQLIVLLPMLAYTALSLFLDCSQVLCWMRVRETITEKVELPAHRVGVSLTYKIIQGCSNDLNIKNAIFLMQQFTYLRLNIIHKNWILTGKQMGFVPPVGYWCGNHSEGITYSTLIFFSPKYLGCFFLPLYFIYFYLLLVGGGAFTWRSPTGMTASQSVLPHQPYQGYFFYIRMIHIYL